jgi:hypothetical protein
MFEKETDWGDSAKPDVFTERRFFSAGPAIADDKSVSPHRLRRESVQPQNNLTVGQELKTEGEPL